MTGKGGTITRIETPIVDLPLRRPHRLSRATLNRQSYLIVRIHTEAGIVGTGEGVVPGGPWWGGEAVEGMKALIDTYAIPQLLKRSVFDSQQLMRLLDRTIYANPVAKSAIEVALLDAASRILEIPISDMFGGRRTESLPVLWALGTGQPAADIEEAKTLVADKRHAMFKIKVGFAEPEDDLRRVIATAEAIGLPCSIDFNEAWDRPLASKYLPMLEGSGVVMIEQPVARTDLAGMAALAARLDIPLMADEAVCSPQQALAVVEHRAAEAISLKISKAGGIRRTQQIAAIAESAGLGCFGGTALDSSIGVAASLQLFATLPELRWGCELFAPLLLTDEIVTKPITYRDNHAWVPEGYGTGVDIDPHKLRHYSRPGTGD